MDNNKFYALICFHVLTLDTEMKHPRYLEEKGVMLTEGLNAFAWLDWKNMGVAIAYLKQHEIVVPEVCAEEYKR